MYCRSTLQHQTMLLSMKHWSTTSSWPKRSAFGGFYVMEIPIWWCSNALEIGTQKMRTWQVTDSWCSSYLVSLKDVSSTMSPEPKMRRQMHCQSSDPPEKRYQPECRWRIFTSHLSSLLRNQSQSSFRPT